MQEGKVFAYGSKQFKPHEHNYPTHDLELAVGSSNFCLEDLEALCLRRTCQDLHRPHEFDIHFSPERSKHEEEAMVRGVGGS